MYVLLMGLGGVALLVEHLLYRYKGLHLISRAHMKMPGLLARTYDPSAGEVEKTGSLRLTGQPV